MSSAITPYVAKNAAALVNPTSASVFIPLVINPVAATSAYSAFVSYVVNNQSVSSTTQTAVLYGSHAEGLNTAVFRVRAWGRVTGGTTTNFTPTLLYGRSQTYASNTVMGSLTATAFNSASGLWEFDATLFWDVTSGQLSGSISGYNGATAAIIAAALVTPVTGLTSTALAALSQPNTLYFSIAGLFSASNASNIAYLDGFQVEDI
jgi:hypothetical protein